MPAADEGSPISERPDAVNPFGASASAAGEPAMPDVDAPLDDETGAAEASETGHADQSAATPDSEDAAGAAPLIQGPAMTPTARQKLAEARKGRSRVRFLIIALVLVIVAAVAVSFIRQPDGLNDALRNVPGLDEGGSDGGAAGENTGADPG